MKKLYASWSYYFLFISLFLSLPLVVNGQEKMQTGEVNFSNFSTEVYANQSELVRFSKATAHPEYGKLPYNTPCTDCIELIEERTQYTRKYLVNGTNGKEIKIQKGYSPLHYKDQQGNWITYNPHLKPISNGQFAVNNDYYQIRVDVQNGEIYFKNKLQGLQPITYHKDLQLEKLDVQGNVTSTTPANWSNFSAGDNGVIVSNLFPGIDFEIIILRDNIKTNFIVKQNIGNFRIAETLDQSVLNRIPNTTGNLDFIDIEDNGGPGYLIGGIRIFDNDAEKRQFLNGFYSINGDKLYYNWDQNEFSNLTYPVKIDPTVTSSGTLPQGSINGAGTFANNGNFTTGCTYNLAVPTPANCTITDIDWSFVYVAQNGAVMDEGACKFYYGACVSPATAGFFWFCNNPTAGTCTGTNVSIFSDFQTCVPAPACAPYNMNFTLEFFDAWGAFNTFNCDPTYITAGSDWTMVITGETIDQPSPPTSSAGNTICEGQSTTLTATGNFGVPPYSYSWDNGGGAGNPVSVSPTTTTTYTCTITDACGQTANNSFTVNVVPAPDAGTNATVSFCSTDPITSLFGVLGGTPDAGGTWSGPSGLGGGSAGNFNPATMNAGVYTYTVTGTAPCGNASATVTVSLDPSPDAGTNGSTTFCPSDPSADLFGFLGGTPDAGGTWSPAMNSGTGVFDPGIDPAGTYTYTVTNPCGTVSADVVVTINPAPDPGTNGSITLCDSDPATDLFNQLGGTPDGGGTWSPAMNSGTGIFDPGIDPAGTYTYTVTNSCGSASADVVVTVNPSPDAGTNGATSFCPSDAATDLFGFLGGTPDAGGTWSPAMNSGTGVFDPGIDPAGTYTYTVTNGCGTISADVVVTINPTPIAGTNGATNFCPSDAAANLFGFLGGSPDAGGTWSPAMNSGTGVFDPGIDPGGTYTYTVTNSCGSASADVVVTIDPAPIAGTNGATSFCPSDAATDLFGFLGGTPDAGGTWSPAMNSGTGVFDPGIDPGGTYTYTVTNGCGSASADVVVTINPNPDPGTNGGITLCASDPATDLFNELGGTPDVGGTWSPAMNSGTGVFDPGIDPAGTYTYTVTNGCGSASADVAVTIVSAPSAGTNGATSFCPSDAPADLVTFLGGSPDPGGTWSPALTSGTGVFDPLADGAGTYTYTVTASCGTASADVVVTLNPDPDAGTNGAITFCPADTPADLFGSLGGTPDAGGTWSPAMTSGTGVFDPGADPAGTYTYTTTTVCGSASADVVVTIDPAPDAGSNGATAFCSTDAAADLITFLGGTPDAGGTWSPALTSGTGVFDPSVDVGGTYTYTVTNSCGTATGDVTVTLNPAPNAGSNGATTFCTTDSPADLFTFLGGTPDAGGTWSPAMTSGTGVFDPGVDAAGTYTYSVTNICGTATADVVVTVTNNPDPGTNGAATFCSGDPATDLFGFLGGTPDPGGTWSPALTSGTGVFDPSADPAGTYTYTLNACGGGTVTADVVVTINPAPNAGTNGAITLCNNDPITDLFNSLGGGPDVGGTWSPALTSGTGFFDPAQDSAGTYTYTVTNSCGTASSDVVVTVNDCSPPVPSFTMSDTVICLGDCITITDMTTGNPTSWDWDFGGAADPDTSDLQNPTFCPDTAGIFVITLTASNSNGSASTTSQIQVGETPSVNAVGDTIINLGEFTTLNSLVSPAGGTYYWTDGDMDNTIDCPTCPSVVVTPDLTTGYALTYTTAEGCTATDTAFVYITVVDNVDVPNGFSPNSDGENDILFVKGDGIKNMNFTVYNRYGQMIFQSDTQNIGWDGTFRGVPENPGVFAWYLEYTLIDGQTNVKKGNVTLIK